MRSSTYLNFAGTCEEAFACYERVLGGRIVTMLRARGTPMEAHMPADQLDKIMHACLDLGGTLLMGSDMPPSCFQAAQGFSVHLAAGTAEEAERVFAALAEGGTVRMPLETTFWAERFGMLVDRFGVPWMVMYAPPAGAEAGTARAEAERVS